MPISSRNSRAGSLWTALPIKCRCRELSGNFALGWTAILNCDLAANLDDLIRWQSQMPGALGAISLHCGVNGFNDPREGASSLLGDNCFMAHIVGDVRKVHIASERLRLR